MSKSKESKLTAKQQRFAEEYLVDLNATRAAMRAGYSEKTAQKIGSENLSKPDIAVAIAEAQAARSKRTETTQDWVIKRLVAIVELVKSQDPPQLSAANRALELIGKHLGMFKGTLDVNAEVKVTRIERVIVYPENRDR